MKNKKDYKVLAQNELIGLQAKVVRSSDPSLEGLEGKIVDETLNTITIEEKILQKNSVRLLIYFPEGEKTFDGTELMQRPEDRVKKLWKKT